MTSLYGSNRSIYNAIEAVMLMCMEMGIIKRDKVGIYSLSQAMKINHSAIREFVVFTDIKLSGSRSILVDDIGHRPWYMFFEISLGKQIKSSLFRYSEGTIGHGYLCIGTV